MNKSSAEKIIPIMVVNIMLITLLISNANADHQKEFFQDAIRNPTTDNAGAIFSDTIPNELEKVIETSVNGMDVHTDSEDLADDVLFGIFDTVENQIFGDNITRVSEKFGDRIFQLVTNIISKAIEASLDIFNP
ncbi:hypothetical protein [Nitrosopumilus ureiphilus]|uniref:Uncharacterized protein n=1 Tax=Nitrosopumilus ureiphilus TaxID=1470067 RepID=A0A7D5M7H2_9ARCH|nr:hypothetical protein [Nitrosopumilus ureiphilus]QLH06847.1 hypothetical protein C5F50_06975 [Nitrosopumilus ureiphilus]